MSYRRQGDDRAENQRHVALRGCGIGHAPAVGIARPARHERHQVRLRGRVVRRLHRAPGRRPSAVLRDAGERRRRAFHHDHRGDRQYCRGQEHSAGVARPRGRAVRLLSVWPDHVRRRAAREDTSAHRHRYRPGNVGEHLPMRYLSAHPGGDQAGGSEADDREQERLTMDHLTRRQLLFAGAAVGGGFLLGWQRDARAGVLVAATKAMPSAFVPNGFIRVGTDGRVTLIMCQVEMGQGTYTSMSMLLAEELEVGLDQVQFEHAPPDEKLYANPLLGGQETGGSTSVRSFYEPLRQAGATARTMLVAAAAQTWNVGPTSCQVRSGVVTHAPTGRKLAYGALADKAAKLPVPTQVTLKDPREFKLIGTPAKRLDSPAKVNGTAAFGIDVRLPGMKIATVAASPVVGGKVVSVDDSEARAIKGVRQIVRLDDAVAVVADNMWAAKKG